MKNLIVLFLVLSCSIANAQSRIKVSESHGDPFKQKGRTVQDVFELSTGGYWSLTSRIEGSGLMGLGVANYRRVYFVQKYNENLDVIDEKRLNLKFYDKDLSLQKIVKFHGEYYIFLTFDNIKKKKKYLFYALFDQYDLRIDGDLTKIAEIGLGSKSSNTTDGSFDVSVSDNENFVVVFGNEPQRLPKRKGLFNRRGRSRSNDDVGEHTFKFTYWVLDKDFQIVNYDKKHQLKIANSSDKFYIRDYSIDDEGALYILGKNSVVDELSKSEWRKTKRTKWVDVKKSAFILQKINTDGTTEQIQTPDGELFIDMDILFDGEGNVNLVGLTGEQLYSKLVTTGVFRAVYTNDYLEELEMTSGGFEDWVLKEVNDVQESEANMSRRRKKRQKRKESRLTKEEKEMQEVAKRAALNANYIAYSGIDEEGDAVLVLEEQHVRVVTTTTTDANGVTTTTTTYYYHYDDLIMAKFMDSTIKQNFYKKSFVMVNTPLRKSMDVAMKDGEISIMTQGHIVRTDTEFESVKDYELKSFSRKDRLKGMRRKVFMYRKTMDENTILAAAQWRRKLVWYKIKVK
jgi:hypothetical protein